MSQKKRSGPKARPTLGEIRAALPPEDAERVENISIRLIQIQADQKALEAERGYTDSAGQRHKGLADELEELMVIYNLFDGFQIEDYVVSPTSGGNSRIDRTLLLNHAVPPDVIAACTVTSQWTSVRVTRAGEDRDGGKDGKDGKPGLGASEGR